jgi:hypothetical protein
MCDFSLQHVKSRPASVGDKLMTRNFGRGTTGFCPVSEQHINDVNQCTAVCVMPGTEIAFDKSPERYYIAHEEPADLGNVARFRQIEKHIERTHHDALEFADGTQILLTRLREGQEATVLQLPAAPKTEAERIEQTRLEVVG